jgi:APA family basic amino acid/polyamine antiporter
MRKKTAQISTITGVSIVVANMIGTGAFTSLGFQLNDLSNTSTILTLWILGGIFALSGAFSYAEVGTNIRLSGGEYAFLDKLYHPVIGYLSGWVSITVGFAAPIALSAIAFTEYFPWSVPYPKVIGILIVATITWIHSKNLRSSAHFQNISTSIKALIILVFITVALWLPGTAENTIQINASYFQELTTGAFVISLIFVSYSYSGWNAAAYITEEFKNPRRSLPVALIGGTLVVTLLYTLLQCSFLKHVPQAELVNKINVGTISAKYMLGEHFAAIFSGSISLLLISGISAMIWVGPKVTAQIAKKYRLWHHFRENKNGIPTKASWLQFAISALLIISGTFEEILIYCGVLLTFSSLLVVTAVFKLRRNNKANAQQHFRSPFFPFFQILFILLSVWIILFAFISSPYETTMGIINLLIGVITFCISTKCAYTKKSLPNI